MESCFRLVRLLAQSPASQFRTLWEGKQGGAYPLSTMQYELGIRWSMGHYGESRLGKGDKGEGFSSDSSGNCVTLH